MLVEDFKISSFIPPGLANVGDKTYVCPGWHKVPSETTLKEVQEHWTRDLPKGEKKPTHLISVMVDSSKGDSQYEVSFDGTFWNCECAGFGFRQDCRHLKQVKLKHGIK